MNAHSTFEHHAIEPTHPRRFSVRRDMNNGLYDVWDDHRCEYIACDVSRSQAENTAHRARKACLRLLVV